VLPKSLPGFVRWGVDSDAAMRLMVAGLRSRVLARRIAEVYDLAPRAGNIVRWLGDYSVVEIIRMFEPNHYDFRDILECSRRRRRNVLSMAASRSNEKGSVSLINETV
jgi:hypothetical protein